MGNMLFNSSSRILGLITIILLIVVAFCTAWISALPKSRSEEARISTYGTIVYEDTPVSTPYTRSPPAGGIDPSAIVAILAIILPITHAILDLLKWRGWMAKHGRCRTPIFARVRNQVRARKSFYGI